MFVRKKWRQGCLLATSAVWLILHLFTLARYPIASPDEAFWSEVAFIAGHTGRFGVTSHLGLAGLETTVVTAGRLYHLLILLSQQLFGVSLWSGRLPSLIAGIVTTGILYKLGHRFCNKRTGIIAAFLFATSWRTTIHTHSARPEAWLATASVIILWLLWRMIEKPTFWNSAFTGLAAALSVDIHFTGINFAIAATTMATVFLIRSRSWRHMAAFALGGLVGLAYWLLAHFLPDPAIAYYQITDIYVSTGAANLGNRSLLQMLASVPEFYWREFVARGAYQYALSGAYFIAGIVYMTLTRSKGSRFVSSYFLVANLIYAVSTPVKSWYQPITWLPLITLMTAAAIDFSGAFLSSLLSRWKRMSHIPEHVLMLAVLFPLGASFVVGDLYLFYKFRNVSLANYTQSIQDMVPANETLVAPHVFWYAYHDRPFIATTTLQVLEFVEHRPIDETLAMQFLEQVSPAYIVILPNWDTLMDPSSYYDLIFSIVSQSCTLITTFSTEGYPEAQLYFCEDPAAGTRTFQESQSSLQIILEASDRQRTIVDTNCYLDDYVGAVARAANHSGDPDSVACIAGSMSGARVRLDGIPVSWVRRLEKLDYVTDVADRLTQKRQSMYGG